jgi:hypothetical protein
MAFIGERWLAGSHVYLLAHSMGNIVAGEALRIAAQSGDGQLVNTYVASQAAVPAECFDPNQANINPLNYTIDRPVKSFVFGLVSTKLFAGQYGPDTPDIYGGWMANSQKSSNFFNPNDYALHYWQLDQVLKPDVRAQVYYYGTPDLSTVQDQFAKAPYLNPSTGVVDNSTAQIIIRTHVATGSTPLELGSQSNVQDRYEIMAYAAEPRSLPLGGVNSGLKTSSRLPQPGGVWPYDTLPQDFGPYSAHPWHSAQFRFANGEQAKYWNSLLEEFGLPANQ